MHTFDCNPAPRWLTPCPGGVWPLHRSFRPLLGAPAGGAGGQQHSSPARWTLPGGALCPWAPGGPARWAMLAFLSLTNFVSRLAAPVVMTVLSLQEITCGTKLCPDARRSYSGMVPLFSVFRHAAGLAGGQQGRSRPRPRWRGDPAGSGCAVVRPAGRGRHGAEPAARLRHCFWPGRHGGMAA